MTVLLVACALDQGAGFFVINRHLSHATVSVFFFSFSCGGGGVSRQGFSVQPLEPVRN